MNARVWLTTVALALAGLGALAPTAEAEHTSECQQNFDYPPVCCPHKYLVAQHFDPRNPLAGVKSTLLYCDFIP